MFVLLGCENGEKYIKYEYDVQHNIYDTRKYKYHFKSRDKPISNKNGGY